MSLIGGLLAFVLIPLKARPPEPPKPKPDTTEAALDFWRNAGARLMKEVERLREENQRLRSERDAMAREVERHWRQQNALADAQMRQQVQMLAQYQPQQGQLGLQQQNYQNQALAQLAQNDWCNCVPARSQIFDVDHRSL